MMLRLYQMVRHEDETGNSGTGPVAIAVEFPDGKCVLKWDGDSNALSIGSMVLYDCFEDMERVHGHGGKTTFDQLKAVPTSPHDLVRVDGRDYYPVETYLKSPCEGDRGETLLVMELREFPF